MADFDWGAFAPKGKAGKGKKGKGKGKKGKSKGGKAPRSWYKKGGGS